MAADSKYAGVGRAFPALKVAMPRAIAIALLLFAAFLPKPAAAEPRTYKLDREHVTVGFLVEHSGFARILGVFRQVEGAVVFDEAVPALHSIEVKVATSSVDTGHAARDNHLRSADFFDSRNHPDMMFTFVSARQTGERTAVVTGNLTLRGQTHPVDLDVTWNKAGNYTFGDRHYSLGISARGTLRRQLWGMTYGVADGMVGDDVQILIEAELIRQ